MKRKIFVAVGFVLLAVVIGVQFWRGQSQNEAVKKREGDNAADENESRSSPAPLATTAAGTITQPRLFKSTRYPPETPDEKALWEWWRAMDQADPKFQWKMPIEFYGQVVDQFDQPVASATVTFGWTTVVGPIPDPEIRVMSGSDGRFELTGVRGKRLVVRVLKEGYLSTKDSGGGFEYASFSDDMFHVPDRMIPTVFRLQRLMGAEPMLKYITNAEIAIGSAPILLDAETGKLGGEGDVSFNVSIGSNRGQYGPDFSVTISAVNGAGVTFSEEEFMFDAPESGYRQEVVFTRLSSAANYNRVQPYRFYVKTRSGKYAAVDGDITVREGLSEGKAGFHAIIYHNPSGSRNLEFDHRKWINR